MATKIRRYLNIVYNIAMIIIMLLTLSLLLLIISEYIIVYLKLHKYFEKLEQNWIPNIISSIHILNFR